MQLYFYKVFRAAIELLVIVALFTSALARASIDDEPIVVAVVDDGFNVNHEVFRGLVWENSYDVPNNETDDDNNGFVDDLHGFDVSDQDSRVMAPASRIEELDHGTFIAGVVAKTIRSHLGEMSDYPIKLMFIKAVSDSSEKNTVEDGYKGLAYALEAGADVANLSWSGGKSTREALAVLNQAKANNLFIAASMGNFAQADPVFPVSHSAVLGVSGVNADGKSLGGNIGEEADIAAIASEVRSASARSNTAYRLESGVSIATAQVSAAVALMKLANRDASHLEIRSCLQSTSTAVDKVNANQPGKFGAGLLNIKSALRCIKGDEVNPSVIEQPEGVLLHENSKGKQSQLVWRLKPAGQYNGVEIAPFFEGKNKTVTITIVAESDNDKLLWTGNAVDLPSQFNFDESDIRIEVSAKGRKRFRLGMKYAFNIVDLAEQFCRSRLEVTEPATVDDGSGALPYANSSNCEWLITPPPSHNVLLTFTKVDTQLHTDIIHLFAGDTREQQNLLMKLSGQEAPASLMINGGQAALLWFVSDSNTVAGGFQVDVGFVPN